MAVFPFSLKQCNMCALNRSDCMPLCSYFIVAVAVKLIVTNISSWSVKIDIELKTYRITV